MVAVDRVPPAAALRIPARTGDLAARSGHDCHPQPRIITEVREDLAHDPAGRQIDGVGPGAIKRNRQHHASAFSFYRGASHFRVSGADRSVCFDGVPGAADQRIGLNLLRAVCLNIGLHGHCRVKDRIDFAGGQPNCAASKAASSGLSSWADTGPHDDRPATIHWNELTGFEEAFPAVQARRERFVLELIGHFRGEALRVWQRGLHDARLCGGMRQAAPCGSARDIATPPCYRAI